MKLLIVPGLGGSGPDHWQSHWARSYPGARRVEQPDWNRPVRSLWLEQLAAAVERMPGAMLVGHSLGCVLVADLARRRLTCASAARCWSLRRTSIARTGLRRRCGVRPHAARATAVSSAGRSEHERPLHDD